MSRVTETLRMFLALTLPYFNSQERLRARLLLVAVICGELGLVYVAVLMTQWSARFFNALEARNWAAFNNELIVFCFITAAAIAVGMSQYYFGQTLQILSVVTPGLISAIASSSHSRAFW